MKQKYFEPNIKLLENNLFLKFYEPFFELIPLKQTTEKLIPDKIEHYENTENILNIKKNMIISYFLRNVFLPHKYFNSEINLILQKLNISINTLLHTTKNKKSLVSSIEQINITNKKNIRNIFITSIYLIENEFNLSILNNYENAIIQLPPRLYYLIDILPIFYSKSYIINYYGEVSSVRIIIYLQKKIKNIENNYKPLKKQINYFDNILYLKEEFIDFVSQIIFYYNKKEYSDLIKHILYIIDIKQKYILQYEKYKS